MPLSPQRLLRRAIDRIVGGSVARQIARSPQLAGKLLPQGGSDGALVQAAGGDAAPVPPPELWEGYAADPAEYLTNGRRDVDLMLGIVARHAAAPPRVVLDLGCAAGRMIRHYPAADGEELWGLDINARHIAWCQRNLPQASFATITTAPHLPFADGYFELVYCGSVFTHISDLADSWLLELRRVLRPGGLAYVTVHDLESYELLFTRYADDPLFASFVEQARRFEDRNGARRRPLEMFRFGIDPLSQVFYDRDHLVSKWSRWMEVVTYEPQVHDHQSVILLRKRA